MKDRGYKLPPWVKEYTLTADEVMLLREHAREYARTFGKKL
jgi:hypothetical protein